MGIMVLVEALPKSDCVDELVKMLKVGFPTTRAAEGCREITAYLQEDSSTVMVVEIWDSKVDYEKYLAWRVETGAIEALGQLLQAPLNIRFFEAIGA